jgi:hypothetical protein
VIDPNATGGPVFAAPDKCVGCGTSVPTPVPVDWTLQRGEVGSAHLGAFEHLCPGCTREHVRAIEAKLAPDWW